MMYELFIKQFVGYATYHQDERNEITHFFGVPPIFISAVFLFSGSLFRIDGVELFGIPISLGVVIFCALAASWIALDLILGGLVFLLMLPVLIWSHAWADWVAQATGMGMWGVFIVFMAVQTASWAVQILGHVYEGRRPRILENLFQSTLAPLFLLQIIFDQFGWRKKLRARVDEEIEKWNQENGLVKGKPQEAA